MNTPAFTCHRDLIRPLLTRVTKAVEKRNTIPILKNVLIQAESDGTLSITATDLDVKAVGSIDGVDVERPGATTVDAVTFLASISRMPEAPVSVDAIETDLTIKSGRSRAKVKVLPAADFPDIGLDDASHTFVMSALDLTAMLDKCGFAISTEETRYYLNGIFIHEWEGKLVAVATDGHRLSKLTLDLPDGAKNMPGIIVPDRMVKHFGLLAEKADQAVKVELSDRFIRFNVPNLSITSKLIDATYPDYQRVLAVDNPLKAKIPADDLQDALERLLIYADTKYRRVRFDFSAGLLRLSSQSDVGTAADELEVEADFELSIGFNSRYLLDLIKTFKGTRIDLALDTPSSAPLITDAGDDRRLATIMPVALIGA